MTDHKNKKRKEKQPFFFDHKVFDQFWAGEKQDDWCVWAKVEDESITDANVVKTDSTLEEATEFINKYQGKLDDEYDKYVESAYANQKGILGPSCLLFITKRSRPCYSIYYRIVFRNDTERESLRELVQKDIRWVRGYLGDYIAGELGAPVDPLFLDNDSEIGNFYGWQDRFKMIEQIKKLKEEKLCNHHKEQIEKLGFDPVVDYYPVPITMNYDNQADIKDYIDDEDDDNDNE